MNLKMILLLTIFVRSGEEDVRGNEDGSLKCIRAVLMIKSFNDLLQGLSLTLQ